MRPRENTVWGEGGLGYSCGVKEVFKVPSSGGAGCYIVGSQSPGLATTEAGSEGKVLSLAP